MAAHGQQKNLSFLHLATQRKTENLGNLRAKGCKWKAGALSCYQYRTRKQAIEEGFIFDVLENYTTYGTYFQLVKYRMTVVWQAGRPIRLLVNT